MRSSLRPKCRVPATSSSPMTRPWSSPSTPATPDISWFLSQTTGQSPTTIGSTDQPEQLADASPPESRRDLHDRHLTDGSEGLELGFDRRPQPGHDLHSVPGSRP